MERIVAHVGSLASQPMHGTAGGRRLTHALREPLPEHGTPFPQLLRLLFDRVIPRSLNTASPGYLAYVPGGGIFHAAVADLIANAVNRYVGVWVAGPGLVAIEENVIQWLCSEAGLPSATCGGLLTSGGSLANLTAVVTARRTRLPAHFLQGTLYVSDQVHHSVTKAALVAGFPTENVRVVPTDPTTFRVRVDVLQDQLRQDRAGGFTPFMVVGNGGSTNTGAVDDLTALADVAAREKLWFHVDAAYGGAFMLTQRGKHALRGLDRADSITLDPHKGLFLPYGTGCLLVAHREHLRQAHHMEAEYLPRMQEDASLVDYADLSAELSRDWRGLRVWLPLKMHGAAVFRDALNEKLDLAAHAAEGIRALPHARLEAAPQLSLLAFRFAPPGVPDAELDALNRRILSDVNQRQRVLLTGTQAHGRFLIRMCILSFRTHRAHVGAALEDLRDAVGSVVSP